MNFSQKLDFLMNLTNTSNSVLARYTAIDPSHVSRLRSGGRNLAKNADYLRLMAEYFVKKCDTDYQKAALNDAMQHEYIKQDTTSAETERILLAWLLDNSSLKTHTVGSFLNNFSHISEQDTGFSPSIYVDEPLRVQQSELFVYNGIEGKRQGALVFISLVLKQKEPVTIYLSSDEDSDWLTENNQFMKVWPHLLAQAVKRGHKIKVIHTIIRNIDEMLLAIESWLPLYLTGMVEPYYYPKQKDRVFKRTLFVAPGVASLAVSSIGNKSADADAFLAVNKSLVDSFYREFNNYLTLCCPMINILVDNWNQEQFSLLLDFEKHKTAAVKKTDGLSLCSMPLEVFNSINNRCLMKNAEVYSRLHGERVDLFEKNLKQYPVKDLIYLSDVRSVHSGKVSPINASLICEKPFNYSVEEYVAHLKNIVRLLQTYHNYQVFLIDDKAFKKPCNVYIKEKIGVIIAKETNPTITLKINESNVTSAFWDYFNRLVDTSKTPRANRKMVIAKIESLIKQLSVFL